jgi:hypothetical protein
MCGRRVRSEVVCQRTTPAFPAFFPVHQWGARSGCAQNSDLSSHRPDGLAAGTLERSSVREPFGPFSQKQERPWFRWGRVGDPAADPVQSCTVQCTIDASERRGGSPTRLLLAGAVGVQLFAVSEEGLTGSLTVQGVCHYAHSGPWMTVLVFLSRGSSAFPGVPV